MRVVIVEDETLFRQGLGALLTGFGIEVVATAEDAPGGEAAVRTHRPDLLITDIRIPPGNTTDGLELALRLRSEVPGLPVMLLSHFVSRHFAEQLLATDVGAIGYQLKQRVGNVTTFLEDLHRVADGGTVFDQDVVQAMLGHAHPDTGAPLERLTDRQREVLTLVAEGRSNNAIAARLGITERAVVGHISRIYHELAIPDDEDDHRRVIAVLRFLRS